MKEAGEMILTPLTSLDTPGKATVEVIILADPVCINTNFIKFSYIIYNQVNCFQLFFHSSF